MVKIKVIIRKQKDQKTKDGLYNVKISVSHKGATRYMGTQIYILDSQIANGEIINHPSAEFYNIQLRNLRNAFSEKLVRLGMKTRSMTIKELMQYFNATEGNTQNFNEFGESITKNLRKQGKLNYANLIQQTLDKLSDSTTFSEITPSFLQDLYNKMYIEGKKLNTISIHLRNIRRIYNEAIMRGVISQDNYPFRFLKIRSERTAKRNLSIEDLKKIRDKRLKKEHLKRARDLFVLSFYLNGINFKDMLLAKKEDVYNGRLVLSRAKTGRTLSIKIFPEAQKIIKRYQGQKFLLNALEIKRGKRSGRNTPLYKDITDQTNKSLKTVSVQAKVKIPVSTYFARHTLATIARNIGISRDDIGAILGHSQSQIVDVYIDLDSKRIDEAMLRVLEAIR